MSDFMHFLYDHYIRPYVAGRTMGESDWEHLGPLMESLSIEQKDDLAAALRFFAARSFLLGLRTGVGLARETSIDWPIP